MKRITLIFFTFSGIYTGYAQKLAQTQDSIGTGQNAIANIQPIKKDSSGFKKKPSIRLYPNPAKNKVEIDIKGFDRGYVNIQLSDIKGKLIREDKRLVFSGSEIIVLMFFEKPGLYFLWLKQGKKNLRSKLIIQ